MSRPATIASRLAIAAAAFGALIAPPGAAATATSTTSSTNWAGYAVTGKTFKRVSGSWVQPAVDCTSTTRRNAYSASWVGLGGYDTDSTALEQIGTEADCSNGTASYSSWYELVPEAAHDLKLKISAGDSISASVTVSGHTVRMRLVNNTTGKSITKTRTTSNLDLSSAEWIQETPSLCNSSATSCSVLPLADFGSITFANASATTKSGRKGTISDQAWTATAINLIETGNSVGGHFPGGPRAGVQSTTTTTGATTGELDSSGAAFTVAYADDLTVQASRASRSYALLSSRR
ncbi:MAG: G1 family endopeptidase [Patulibacter sp.]